MTERSFSHSPRSAGVLLDLRSLPSPHGIGDLGPEAHAFIDFLARAGQSYWQFLPSCPTSPVSGDSPYMSPSAGAGDPLLISPELLVEQGLLAADEAVPPSFDPYRIETEQVRAWKGKLLETAWQRYRVQEGTGGLEEFCRNHPWVEEHAFFLALKKHLAQAPWWLWPTGLRRRHSRILARYRQQLAEEIRKEVFCQLLFDHQWQEIRSRARASGIHLIGDLPIYVAQDSVDVWAHQDIFDLDAASGLPNHVAGVPPDYFSTTGQRWGNPLYRWNSRSARVRNRLTDWWQERFRMLLERVDVIRIDHFRGFESYWAIPAGEKDGRKGIWRKGPGTAFFRAMEKGLGPLPVIAEDLGLITPAVEKMRDTLGYPGMKILLFAFDGQPDNPYLPRNMPRNCVVYTGTHDNDTAVGWYLDPATPAEARRQAKALANREDDEAGRFHMDLIHLAFSSPARLAVIPMQDWLGFGNDCRLNTPGTSQGNWQWRLAPGYLSPELAAAMRERTALHGRLGQAPSATPQPGR